MGAYDYDGATARAYERRIVWRRAYDGSHAYLAMVFDGKAIGRGEALCSFITLGEVKIWSEPRSEEKCKECLRVITGSLTGIPIGEL
jgi:hypothetical protein